MIRFSGLTRDIRIALRLVARRPSFSAIAVLTIALGIAATTSVFSIVNGVLLQPLPYPDEDRLVVLGERHDELFSANWFVSPANFRDWRERNRVFEEMVAWQRCSLTLTGDGSPERFEAMRVSAGFFEMMGLPPLLGRGFMVEEDLPGSHRVVVLSHRLWQRRFGGDSAIVGATVILEGEPHQVVGVAAKDFRFTRDVELWAPLALDYDVWPRDLRWVGAVGRMRPGTSMTQALDDMERVAVHLGQEHPETNAGWRVDMELLKEQMVGGFRPALLLLLTAVLFVLAIAIANVANLQLSQGVSRHREVAVRRALGASRPRLVRQLLTESLVLALAGGGLGLLLAVLGTEAALLVLPVDLPRAADVGVDGPVLAFTTIVTLLTGLVFGAVPALHASRSGLIQLLHGSGRAATAGRGSLRLRNGLVGAEVALALLLLVGASLMISTLMNLLGVDPGFATQGVLTAEVELPPAAYPDDSLQVAAFEQMLQRIRALPGVESAGTIFPMPMIGATAPSPFMIDGQVADQESTQEAPYWLTSPGAVEALGIPLLRGRLLSAADTAAAPVVVLVNETFVRRFLPQADPIGRQLAFGRDPAAVADGGWATIIGVVGDVHHDALVREPGPQLYLCSLQAPFRAATIAVQVKGRPEQLAQQLRAAINQVDADLPVTGLRTTAEIVSSTLGRQRFTMILLGLFAGVAVVLAAIGIYGVLSFLVVQRSREIGIRIALGSSRASVLRQMLGQGLAPVLAGVAAGVLASLWLTRLLTSLVHGVSTTDPLLLGSMVLVMLLVAAVASLLPAWRASRIDPMVMLRHE